MPRYDFVKKVMVIGSGPIIIGQAAEFDYAGTQACRVLKDEGLEVVLVNSNPATIMTDEQIADRVYIEPLTINTLKNIIRKEKPDSLLPTLGGQTGLNLAMELAESGFLEENGVTLLGTSIASIRKAEDREVFKDTMQAIGEPVIDSVIAEEVQTALDFANEIGYPVIVRPAYTLGGTGGGIAEDEDELKSIAADGIRLSRVHQALIEKCVAGWKEIEFEVLRDRKGNAITVCSMENLDPVGIHTGDSIVVAPTQTLSNSEYQMLRSASINIINSLGIEGGCNAQFALDTVSKQYYVIEVNPRVSRSSALASKATGYPIAKVSTKIAIGYTLDEIVNGVTGKTMAAFEPSIDYIVLKFPRWPFDKFTAAKKTLGTKMKATGEVMSIAGSFEAAFLKALRSLELGMYSSEFHDATILSDEMLNKELNKKTDMRIFYVMEALRRGVSVDTVSEITTIDPWFLNKLLNIVTLENEFKINKEKSLNCETLSKAKIMGFSDKAISKWTNKTEDEIRYIRKQLGINNVYKMVDTCAAEFKAVSPYYYSTYDFENEVEKPDKKCVVVLGSGPIRIGQGIEFDYCSVHCIWALKEAGYDTVVINNNPETVSTDFDTADRLYFEPLTAEEVLNVLEIEKPIGVFVQFGGQTAIKLTKAVADHGYKILGTQLEYINKAEDREEFDELLESLKIARPKGKTVFTADEAAQVADQLGYPVLVRPSYVLGGQGMEIARDEKNIRDYMEIINRTEQEHPILVDKYLLGKELEVDAICDGENVLIPGIMEHIERAGVHSGDSISVYPAFSISNIITEKIIKCTTQLALSLHTIGLINIQFILYAGDLYIIEVNPRSSRTVPYISKVTGLPMVDLAVRCALGEKLTDMGYGTGLYRKSKYYAVKVPVFSFDKLPDLEVSLGPEMKSTGEVLGLADNLPEALLKGLFAAGFKVPRSGEVLLTVANADKQELIPIAQELERLGYTILATGGTARRLNEHFIAANRIGKIGEEDNDILDRLRNGRIKLVINTATKGRNPESDGFKIRRTAVEQSVACLTSLDTAAVLVESLKLNKNDGDLEPIALQEIK